MPLHPVITPIHKIVHALTPSYRPVLTLAFIGGFFFFEKGVAASHDYFCRQFGRERELHFG